VHILICPDKFKASLTAQEAAEAIASGILAKRKKSTIQIVPLADGGEGTLEMIQNMHGGEWLTHTVNDPLGRPVNARYLWLADQKTAYIEMARCSGLQLLTTKERNPLKTNTFGTGELIQHAAKQGATTIVLTIGGSATNDAGIGMAAALGYSFLDASGNTLDPIGENLVHVAEIKGGNPFPNIEFIVLTDVDNPLHGPQGAAHVFAKQKGANVTSIKQLDKGLINIAKWLPANIPGAGAAGGLGAGAMHFLDAQLTSGAEWLLNKIHFDRAIRKADFVITGEGKIDGQTWSGKLVAHVVERANKQFKQSILVCGTFEDEQQIPLFMDARDIFPIMKEAKNEADAMKNAASYLQAIGEKIALNYL
jgi:glycerate kinase